MEFVGDPIPANVKLEGGRIDQPVKTWFFEKSNGSIVSVQEAEAWRIWSGKNQIVGQQVARPKLIGVSDGKLYFKALVEAREVAKAEGLEKAQERIRQGYQEEIESARGNIVAPRNFDTIGNNGDAVRVSDLR